MSTRDDQLVGSVEDNLDSGDYYELSSPSDGTYVMSMATTDKDNDGTLISFTREELTAFIEQCKVYLSNPDY